MPRTHLKSEHGKKSIAVFDIDGTIFRSSLMTQLYLALVREKIFPPEAERRVTAKFRAWTDRNGSYRDYIMSVVHAYERHIVGVRPAVIERLANRIIREQKNRVYAYTRNLVEKLRQTHLLVAISGSPIETVRAFNKYWHFDHVFGEVWEVDGGKYTGRVVMEPVYEKRVTLEAFVDAHHLSLKGSIGVGDTEADVSFLEMVEKPICFNPNQPLYDAAKKRGWKIVVERKDVIYEL